MSSTSEVDAKVRRLGDSTNNISSTFDGLDDRPCVRHLGGQNDRLRRDLEASRLKQLTSMYHTVRYLLNDGLTGACDALGKIIYPQSMGKPWVCYCDFHHHEVGEGFGESGAAPQPLHY